jgi:hypothetical protein
LADIELRRLSRCRNLLGPRGSHRRNQQHYTRQQ